jgi:hypothetical protein
MKAFNRNERKGREENCSAFLCVLRATFATFAVKSFSVENAKGVN